MLQPEDNEKDFFEQFSQKQCEGHKKKVSTIDFNCNGKYLASANHSIRVWQLDQVGLVKDKDFLTKDKEFKGYNDLIEEVSWHPTDPNILGSVSKDGTMKLFDIRSKGHIRNEKNKNNNLSMTWSPDGQKIAVGIKDNIVQFFDYNKNSALSQLKFSGAKEITALRWDPTGQVIFVTGYANNVGTVYVLDGKNPTLNFLEQLECHTAMINCIEIDPNKKYFVTGANDALLAVWDIYEMACHKTLVNTDGLIKNVSFSYDGKYIATASEDNYVDIYNLSTFTHAYRKKFDYKEKELWTPNCVKWHPKQYILAYVGEDKKSDDSGSIHIFGLPHK